MRKEGLNEKEPWDALCHHSQKRLTACRHSHLGLTLSPVELAHVVGPQTSCAHGALQMLCANGVARIRAGHITLSPLLTGMLRGPNHFTYKAQYNDYNC